ncbi:MAG TPA: lipoprotein [Guyparkeria sp.]|nr:lipoprotein [Guyparkeria sp.]
MPQPSMYSLLPHHLAGAGLLLATLWLVGCGQKGPLYLPGDEPTVTSATESDSPTTTDQD